MNIAIDCRYLGKSGIGRVCKGILDELDYKADHYYLIGKKEMLFSYTDAEIIEDNTDPYTVKGLFSFPKKLNKICDAVVIPNFLIPLGIKIPVHSVMHDLIFLDRKETTRGFKDRLIKKILLKRGMKHSKTVSCDSEFTFLRCRFYFRRWADKCYVNYPGMSAELIAYAENHRAPAKKENAVVFVGNVKPHKGISTLLSAFGLVEGKTLKIIGEKDCFLTASDFNENEYENVVFTGKLSDEELFAEIAKVKFLVLPSKYEGFGLPPLEALCLGTQPIVSNIEVFREVYEGFPVVFFTDEKDLAEKLSTEPAAVDCKAAVYTKYSYKKFVGRMTKFVRRTENKF